MNPKDIFAEDDIELIADAICDVERKAGIERRGLGRRNGQMEAVFVKPVGPIPNLVLVVTGGRTNKRAQLQTLLLFVNALQHVFDSKTSMQVIESLTFKVGHHTNTATNWHFLCPYHLHLFLFMHTWGRDRCILDYLANLRPEYLQPEARGNCFAIHNMAMSPHLGRMGSKYRPSQPTHMQEWDSQVSAIKSLLPTDFGFNCHLKFPLCCECVDPTEDFDPDDHQSTAYLDFQRARHELGRYLPRAMFQTFSNRTSSGFTAIVAINNASNSFWSMELDLSRSC